MSDLYTTWIECPVDGAHLVLAGIPIEAVPDRPHCTLLFLGDLPWATAQKMACDVATYFFDHATGGPLEATINGWGTFLVFKNKVPVVLLDSPDLCSMAQEMRELLVEGIADKHDVHGFTAHVTLTSPAEVTRAVLTTIPELHVIRKQGRGKSAKRLTTVIRFKR